MTDLECNPAISVAREITELVRGHDQKFLDQFMPLVRRQSVSIDLRAVTRIDAAGLAALIRLYREAHEAGHCFSVCNLSPHVREILALVGLDEILRPQTAGEIPYFSARFEESAA
jgi:anti-anti-sigma factor